MHIKGHGINANQLWPPPYASRNEPYASLISWVLFFPDIFFGIQFLLNVGPFNFSAKNGIRKKNRSAGVRGWSDGAWEDLASGEGVWWTDWNRLDDGLDHQILP